MSVSRFAPQLLLSPSVETEALVLRMLRSQSLLLLHVATAAATCMFLVLLNVLIDGMAIPWSVFPVGAWAVLLGAHWLLLEFGRRRRDEAEHWMLAKAWEDSASQSESSGLTEIRDLREKLLTGAEAAREALRPISPEATADVSRGEASALDLVAWLDRAEPLLTRTSAARALRQKVAAALSKPISEADRSPLENLLTQLDLQDVKLAVLERETSRRRSVLESFLLVLESAGVAGSSAEVLTAVSDPLRGRVRLLEEVARSAVEGAQVGEGSTPASDRIREEVRLAQELQRSILPSEAPEIPGLEVAHFYRPSSEVGGDFFDFYATAPGRLLVAVGDASGHGLDSSMMSSMMKSALYTHVSAGRSLDESMVEMNRMMCDTVGRRRLMTLALLEIDVAAHRVKWVNAGHVFPLLVSGNEVRELEQSSYPLGVRREVDYKVLEEALMPADRIVLVTDGCIEALDADGEVYGWDRLGERLREVASGDSQAIVDGLAEDFWKHLDGQPAQDDITMVVVTFEP
jgi:serine phosphatase RsbU (regulator of sigma subunit)